jgi:hypothetical protein
MNTQKNSSEMISHVTPRRGGAGSPEFKTSDTIFSINISPLCGWVFSELRKGVTIANPARDGMFIDFLKFIITKPGSGDMLN